VQITGEGAQGATLRAAFAECRSAIAEVEGMVPVGAPFPRPGSAILDFSRYGSRSIRPYPCP
jgi:hypothetical protein